MYATKQFYDRPRIRTSKRSFIVSVWTFWARSSIFPAQCVFARVALVRDDSIFVCLCVCVYVFVVYLLRRAAQPQRRRFVFCIQTKSLCNQLFSSCICMIQLNRKTNSKTALNYFVLHFNLFISFFVLRFVGYLITDHGKSTTTHQRNVRKSPTIIQFNRFRTRTWYGASAGYVACRLLVPTTLLCVAFSARTAGGARSARKDQYAGTLCEWGECVWTLFNIYRVLPNPICTYFTRLIINRPVDDGVIVWWWKANTQTTSMYDIWFVHYSFLCVHKLV